MHRNAPARGNKDFLVRNLHSIFFVIELCNLCAQFGIAAHVRIFCVAALGVCKRRINNPFIRDQIRIAETKVNQIIEAMR